MVERYVMPLVTTYLLMVLTAIMWGANFNLAKPVLAEMPPLTAAASRYLISAAIMLVLAQIRREHPPLRHAKAYLILGGIGVFAFNLFFFAGLVTTSAINGALIMALNPLLTSLIAYFILNDQPTRRQLLAFPVGLFGVGIVVLGAGAHIRIAFGDILVFAASLCWALYNVLVRKLMPNDASGIANTAGIMTTGSVALTAVVLLRGERFFIPSTDASAALLTMAVCGGVLAFLFWNAGIAKLGPARAAIFMNLVPVASMTIASLTGAPPTPAQLLGGGLVIGAVTFSSLPS